MWAGIIFGLSSLHGSVIPNVNVPSADKLVHIVIYGVLGALTSWALTNPAHPARSVPRLVLGAVLIATVYGLSDEVHQWFVPGRSADPLDLAADFVGSLLGSAVLTVAWHRRRAGAIIGRAGKE